jgi:hypothetical protein
LELPDASCKPCARTINDYEWTVGRWIFGDFRIRHNLRSKRPKKQRPQTIEVEFRRKDGGTFAKTISRSEFPAPLFMYKFGTANQFLGLPPGTGVFDWSPYVISSDDEMRAFHAKHGKSVHRVKMVPVALARMLGKIGHAYAVAEWGYESFHPSQHNLDTILRRTDDVAFTVGAESELKPPIPNAGHITAISLQIEPPQPPLLIVLVRLFASIPTPDFHVIAGTIDLQNPQHLAALTQKMQNAESIEPF